MLFRRFFWHIFELFYFDSDIYYIAKLLTMRRFASIRWISQTENGEQRTNDTHVQWFRSEMIWTEWTWWQRMIFKLAKNSNSTLHITTSAIPNTVLLVVGVQVWVWACLYTMPLIYNPCHWHWMNSFMRNIIFAISLSQKFHPHSTHKYYIYMWRWILCRFIMYYHNDCCSAIILHRFYSAAYSVTINCVYSFELISPSPVISNNNVLCCVSHQWHFCCLLLLLLLL